LDLLKFLFAVMILVFHGSKNLRQEGTQMLMPSGSIAVDFFFLVSGCMMAMSAMRHPLEDSLGKDTFTFMKRKIFGLCPNVYVAWIIAFAAGHFQGASLRKIARDAINGIWELLFLNESGLLGTRANTVSWYLSVMVLAMLIIYPVMRKCGDTFFYVIAPAGFIFIMGITYQNWSTLAAPTVWRGFAFKGFIRGFMEILGGCICYTLATAIKKHRYTGFARFCFTIAEWGGYLIVAAYAALRPHTKYGWLLVISLMVGITITVSQESLTGSMFQGKVVAWLGAYSFSLYLSHGYWSHVLADLYPAAMGNGMRYPIYLLVSASTGLVVMYVSIGLKKWWRLHAENVKKLFVM
jgi:peptidoglycan/LPS O-acetylase OafA/YrhL